MQVAAKIAPKDFAGKTGSKEIVNRALQLKGDWKKYSFVSVGDDKKYYELLKNGKACHQICSGWTFRDLKRLVDETKTDLKKIYASLFNASLPAALEGDEETLKVFINAKLKNYPGLEGWILKSSNGKNNVLIVGKRPNSVTE